MEASSDLFLELLDESRIHLHGMRALRIVLNNAGVSHLLEGQPENAIELFAEGTAWPGHEVHRLGLLVNQFIARFILGDQPQEDELMKTAERTLNGFAL